jgi:hypothetical protein
MKTPRDVLRFWIPLSLTWMMMSIEGPILTSAIARLPFDAINLAAYGVALAIAMLIESPVIQLLSTSVALARDAASMAVLKRFTWRVNIGVTIGMIVVTIPPIYDVLALYVIDLPLEVEAAMYWGLVCLIPWPGAIGYRRFYQGIMIRHGFTRQVAYGTVMRLVTIVIVGIALLLVGTIPGVIVGTVTLSTAVIFEAIATRYMAREALKVYAHLPASSQPPATMREITKFWLPLAATSGIGFVVTPMLAMFMSRMPNAIESLAVLPVVDSFVFFFRSFGFSYQEVGVALIGQRFEGYAVVRRVGVWIMLATTASLVAITFTPLLGVLFEVAYGLNPLLTGFAMPPTTVLIILPSLAVAYSLHRSVLISARQNVKVAISTILEVSGIALVMTILVSTTSLQGAMAAAVAMSVGRVGSTLYLWVTARKALRSEPSVRYL